MKLVTAVIRPFKLESVREALAEIGIPHMTVSEVQGYGRQKGRSAKYRGPDYQVAFLPKMKIEVAIDDEAVERVIDAILQSARTGGPGDGKILVLPLDRAIRVRTGETSSDALR